MQIIWSFVTSNDKKKRKMFFFAVNVDTGNTRSVMLTDQLCQNSNQIPATVQVSLIVLYNKDAKLLIITITEFSNVTGFQLS